MTQTAAGQRHGAVRRRAGRGGRHRGAVPGRGRGRAGRRRLRPAARRGRPCDDALAGRDACCSPRPGTNVIGTLRRCRRRWTRPVRRLRGRGQPEIVNQRVAPAPMETRCRGRGLGRGRPADRLDPQPGRAGHQGRAGRACSALEPDQVRVITPDVGGAFGAKFGADPEHAVVAWVARQLGRPARWIETRYENLLGMTHGRAQLQTVTIGGLRDGTVLAYRLEVLQDCGAYPRIGAFLPLADPADGAGPVRHPAGRVVAHVGGHQHHAGRGLPRRRAAGGDRGDRAGDGPVRRRDRDGPGRGAAEEPAAHVHRAAHRPRSARCTTPATTRPRWTRCWRRPATTELRAEQASAGAPRRRDRSSASAWPPTSRSPAAATRPARPNENATVEVHPDGTRHDPDRHLAARAGPRDRVGDAGQRGARHPGREDHRQVRRHRPDPARAAAPAARAACSRAARRSSRPPASCSTWPASGPPTCSRPTPADLVFDVGASAFSVAGRPGRRRSRWPSWPRPSGCSCARVFTAPGATFPFGAHVAVVEVDTETGKVDAAPDGRPSTTPGTILNPLLAEGQRHGGIAQGAAQALLRGGRLRRRRQPADRHASPTTRSCPRPRCRASSWSTWRRRPPTTRSAPRASARPARSAPPRPCRTR